MRMRKKKNAPERLELCGSLWVKEPCANAGRWREVFGNEAPLHIEIGCGKGGFITEIAQTNPHINYVAVEKLINVIVLAAERVKNAGLSNVRFVLGDAALLSNMFGMGEVQRIYLNFCDPWPKRRHEKRRLTHKAFLDIYKYVLAPESSVFFKTDNRALFDYSVQSFEQCGFLLKNLTLDLHNSGIEGNIMTEYEKLFSDMGFPIYALEAVIS
ncbi:MAG: tRNA (guanine-N(7)-)-methyltransferase [Firmicutes bacterium ADurb.Bin193]|nr:MAG: tRNA (guanine-N(7)-)-methyltransferase [Firmicutes bacterium ADurb.Bin193]